MKTSEYLAWVLDYYREEHRGISDAEIYALMREEFGEEAQLTRLMERWMRAGETN